jgi:hypothetical protein
MTVKLVYENDGQRESMVTMNCIPRIGEKVQMEVEGEAAEVIQVMYTPWSEEHQAVVTLRKGKAAK